MSDSQLGELARCAAYRILMAFGTSSPIVDGAQSAVDIVQGLVNFLIEIECVAGRFGETVAGTLGTGILDEGRRVKACRRFGRWW
jgi:hypothetical protein